MRIDKRNFLFYLISISMIMSLLIGKFFNIKHLSSSYSMLPFFGLYLFFYFSRIKLSNFDIVYFLFYILVNVVLIGKTGRTDEFSTVIGETMVMFLFFVILPSIISKDNQIFFLLKAINFILLSLLLLSILSSFGLGEIYLLSHKNGLGQIRFISLFYSFFLYLKTKNKFFGFCTIIYFLFLMMTLSRTAMLAGIVFFSVYFLLNTRENKLRNFGIVFIGITLFLILMNSEIFTTYINQNIIKDPNRLFSGREIAWETGIQVIKNNYLFGLGRGTSEEVLLRFALNQYHSYYIEVLAEVGVINFLLFIIISLKAIKSSIRLYYLNKILGSVYVSAFVSVFVYMIAESFAPYAYSFLNALSALFVYTIPFAYLKNEIRIE